MLALVEDEWLYRVSMNGIDISNDSLKAWSILGFGYAWRYRHDLFGHQYVGADGHIAIYRQWGRVTIERIGHR